MSSASSFMRGVAATLAILALYYWLYPPKPRFTVTGPRACDALVLDANGNTVMR